jgi:hypothetical protein
MPLNKNACIIADTSIFNYDFTPGESPFMGWGMALHLLNNKPVIPLQ